MPDTPPSLQSAQRMANAAGVLGLGTILLLVSGFLCGLTFPIAFVTSLLALGLGHVARNQLALHNAPDPHHMARTGMICGYITLGVIAAGLLLVLIVVLAGGSLPWLNEA